MSELPFAFTATHKKYEHIVGTMRQKRIVVFYQEQPIMD